MQFHPSSYLMASTQCSFSRLIPGSCTPMTDNSSHLDEFCSCQKEVRRMFLHLKPAFSIKHISKHFQNLVKCVRPKRTPDELKQREAGQRARVRLLGVGGWREMCVVDVRAQWRLTVHYLSLDWSTVLLAEVNSAYFPPL